MFKNFFIHLILTGLLIINFSTPVLVDSSFQFNKNKIFTQQQLYSLPDRFNTVDKIQKFLEKENSILANYQVKINFEPDDRILKNQEVFPNVKDSSYLPTIAIGSDMNRLIPASEFIWKMSRTGFSNSCGTNTFDGKNLNSICYNNSLNPINPAFVLALIQKESGLVYGACAKPDADTNPACGFSKPSSIQKLNFRLERATGYYCFESSRDKSCWDENPNWRFYKGFFRQVYYAIRLLRIREKTCDAGAPYTFTNWQGSHEVGKTVTLSGQPVTYENGMTCSLYIYTPHISDSIWKVMKDLGGLENDFNNKFNLGNEYLPKKTINEEVR